MSQKNPSQQLTHIDHVKGDHGKSADAIELILVLDGLKIPANIGSLFRLADAMGIEKILFTGDAIAPPNKNITRTARSTDKYIPFEVVFDRAEAIEQLSADGYHLVALEITTDSQPIATLRLPANSRVALIVGEESRGVSEQFLMRSQTVVHIPMRGTNSSMNVATAAAIAVYEICRQLRGQ